MFAGLWQTVSINPKNNKEDVTAGNVTHVKKANGLDEYSYELTVVCDDGSALATYIRKLAPHADEQELDLGIRGNAPGDPRMLQNVLIDEAPVETSTEKKAVVFKVKISGNGEPILDMFDVTCY